jgi:molybdopterin-containing oxidoreductase family membrane subunit
MNEQLKQIRTAAKAEGDSAVGASRLIAPGQSLRSVTEKITSIALAPRTPQGWMVLMAVAGALVLLLLVSLAVLLLRGVGIWGVNQPVAWGLAIVNFVWWIGIGHAGTLISAILLLFRQRWRNSISRFAEAMTVFAVVCAGLFPVIHLGRPWLFYWLFPYPNSMQMWPQFRSPLLWDVFAVCTYATLSIVFWYVGMIPDFATLRDRAQARPAQIAYGLLSLGWRGSARHWARYETTTLLLAGLATPLVLSVHTVISFDFAVSLLPGWHSTIFPPYFVAGAIYSGMAMVVTLAIPLRKFYRLESLVTRKHIDNMGKVMLAAGLIVAYGYMMEAFMAWYSASPQEAFMMWNRAFGPQAWIYWLLIVCNLIVPLTTLWSPRLRTNLAFMFCLSIVVNVGMWLERYVIVVTSLERDYIPAAWGSYKPTIWDWLTYAGTLGLFLALFLIFVRLLPIVPMNEVRAMLPEARVKEAAQ